ncbi:MAG: wax ester/triacylglycerol synthase family O-acyltransferase [Myxococcota bacterium]|nr:wax ester/triacylglycerol synthase family O-acyltransferase [Myxococcota bacterium]
MPHTHYDRLTAIDGTFLAIEDPNVHMHVGAAVTFERGPLARPDGTLDIERLRRFMDASLASMPRFRQRCVQVPYVGERVWVDDERFNLDYHIRHTALPPPGEIRQLKRLAGRLLSQKLDPHKPLWEMWLVEGLENDHFAMILKAHHAMVDGIGGMDLFASLLRLEPTDDVPDSKRWFPRAAPSPTQLVADELRRRASLPWSALGSARQALARPLASLREARESVGAVGEALGAGLAPTMSTPLNGDLGPYRRFDWCTSDIGRIREVRKQLGGTLNDVVLATVAGAVGRFLRRRGEQLNAEQVFRAMVPVSLRKASERGRPGNRVVNFLARLPIDERDPERRLERTIEITRRLKSSRLVQGAEVLEELGDLGLSDVLSRFVRLSADARAYNIVVTNVPGPNRPLYLLSARMLSIHPVVPLFKGQCVGIALFSYDGRLHWGFNADWDALPDLHDLVEDVEAELEALCEAAGLAQSEAECLPPREEAGGP